MLVNPVAQEAEIGGSWSEASPGKKLVRPYLNKQVGCVPSVILGMWEVYVGGLVSKTGPGKKLKIFI
jgi:hypothetical protein